MYASASFSSRMCVMKNVRDAVAQAKPAAIRAGLWLDRPLISIRAELLGIHQVTV